jgi:2-keto-3-deoxy-L-rhamnonate aldolase RhmA/pimeloyl-ACP methyl ester carboxylesterase
VKRFSLQALLQQRTPLTALLAKMPCAAQVESAGLAGFDLVILDTEHGAAGGVELEHHLRAAQAVGLPALVRVPSADPAGVLAALDARAAGVVLPHVLDAESAEAAVVAAHYPPRGRRGVATSTRAGGYGTVGLTEHLRRARDETCVVVQIEDAAAVPRAGEILAVSGVSAVLIGVTDLSVSLGHPDAAHPEVEAAVAAIVAAASRAGSTVIAVAGNAAEAAAWRARGASVIAVVSTTLIRDAFARAVRDSGAAVSQREQGPLVLLPGMLGTGDLWDGVAPALAERVSVRIGRIDLDDSVPEMAESVLAAAPARFALVGHSLGGTVALEVVRRAPERVTRVALLNASARPASEAQLETWAELEQRTVAGDFAAFAHEFAVENLSPGRRSDGRLVERVESMALEVGPAAFRRQLAAQRSRPDLRPSLSRVSVPALVLTGGQDEISPRDVQAEVADGIHGSEHVTVEAAGHLTPLEAPDDVADHLLAWLERWER